MAEIALTSEQKVKVTLAPTTATGKPSSLDGAATFEVVSGDATVENIDELSAYIISGTAGVSVVSVSADADLGEGVVTITDSITVTVSDPLAANLGLVVGTPEPKDAAPEA
jgi:hypothetical protein